MKGILFFLIIIGLSAFVLTIINLMISYFLSEKHKLIEQFEEKNKVLNEKLNNKINFQKTSIKLLKHVIKDTMEIVKRVPESIIKKIDESEKGYVDETDDDETDDDETDDDYVDEEYDDNVIVPHEVEIIPKKEKEYRIIYDISKLSKNEMKLGDNFIDIKFNNKKEELKNAMKKINLEPTEDSFKNYCLFRSAIGSCQLGRDDCKSYCEQDNRGIIWG